MKLYNQDRLSGLGKLIKVLPTGTVFLFHFLSPVLTNNGDCKNNINKYYLSIALLGVCGLSCFFSTFTDSYEDSNGITHYGFAPGYRYHFRSVVCLVPMHPPWDWVPFEFKHVFE
ncbi:hypothetical protein RHMOL_Rhmol02G0016700 [Rhododendron molle]|uniref:Uncharacterized protein n=1 Tax=Rhododendron molle TaxID=49168 RepID=A0ACC0PMW7_RHOML|nr:hypothetical protein RHMOL_Rhmol02G0016700 [Rhododendron molle]